MIAAIQNTQTECALTNPVTISFDAVAVLPKHPELKFFRYLEEISRFF